MPVPHLRRDARAGLATFDIAELTRRRSTCRASRIFDGERRKPSVREQTHRAFLLRPGSDRARLEDGRSDDHAPVARPENAVVGGHHGQRLICSASSRRASNLILNTGCGSKSGSLARRAPFRTAPLEPVAERDALGRALSQQLGMVYVSEPPAFRGRVLACAAQVHEERSGDHSRVRLSQIEQRAENRSHACCEQVPGGAGVCSGRPDLTACDVPVASAPAGEAPMGEGPAPGLRAAARRPRSARAGRLLDDRGAALGILFGTPSRSPLPAQAPAPSRQPVERARTHQAAPRRPQDRMAGRGIRRWAETMRLDFSNEAGGHELSQDEIDARFRAKEDAVLGCVARARPDEYTFIPGRVTVRFRIERTGSVKGCRSRRPSSCTRAGSPAASRASWAACGSRRRTWAR